MDPAVIAYNEQARFIDAHTLMALDYEAVYGTNLHQALKLARQVMQECEGEVRVIVIGDTAPTAHCLPDGSIFFNYPPIAETAQLTLEDAREAYADRRMRVDCLQLRPGSEFRAVAAKLADACGGQVGVLSGPSADTSEVGFFLSLIGLR
jgi:uncharacterized protein with von Willebrand factor type A (vWA) domain